MAWRQHPSDREGCQRRSPSAAACSGMAPCDISLSAGQSSQSGSLLTAAERESAGATHPADPACAAGCSPAPLEDRRPLLGSFSNSYQARPRSWRICAQMAFSRCGAVEAHVVDAPQLLDVDELQVHPAPSDSRDVAVAAQGSTHRRAWRTRRPDITGSCRSSRGRACVYSLCAHNRLVPAAAGSRPAPDRTVWAHPRAPAKGASTCTSCPDCCAPATWPRPTATAPAASTTRPPRGSPPRRWSRWRARSTRSKATTSRPTTPAHASSPSRSSRRSWRSTS